MTGKPWSRTPVEFIIAGRYFRVVPEGDEGDEVSLSRWSFRLRGWEPLGVFASRAEARAAARRIQAADS